MSVDMIFKIAAIGILVAVLSQVLIRSGRDDQAMMVSLAGLIIVLMMVVGEVKNLFDTIKMCIRDSLCGARLPQRVGCGAHRGILRGFGGGAYCDR